MTGGDRRRLRRSGAPQIAIQVPEAAIEAFCRRHHIRRLALFGSVLREDFQPTSDVDVLVEFEPGHVPGFRFVDLEEELTRVLGRQVDLTTPGGLSRYFRERVLAESHLLYAA